MTHRKPLSFKAWMRTVEAAVGRRGEVSDAGARRGGVGGAAGAH